MLYESKTLRESMEIMKHTRGIKQQHKYEKVRTPCGTHAAKQLNNEKCYVLNGDQ